MYGYVSLSVKQTTFAISAGFQKNLKPDEEER